MEFIQTAMMAIVLATGAHADSCKALPTVLFDTDALTEMSRVAAPQGRHAVSAYVNSARIVVWRESDGSVKIIPANHPTIIMRTDWSVDDHEDRKKFYHEMTHHVLTTCIHFPHDAQEPIAIQNESLAP